MKSRVEVAKYINSSQCSDDGDKDKFNAWHFGKCELRALMDFIYEGEPQNDDEVIYKLD